MKNAFLIIGTLAALLVAADWYRRRRVTLGEKSIAEAQARERLAALKQNISLAPSIESDGLARRPEFSLKPFSTAPEHGPITFSLEGDAKPYLLN